jgi:hypothetical protein
MTKLTNSLSDLEKSVHPITIRNKIDKNEDEQAFSDLQARQVAAKFYSTYSDEPVFLGMVLRELAKLYSEDTN